MRVHGFDVLRGLCALGVVMYHVLGSVGYAHPYNLGLYGVYVFFVLSGASLWIAYADKMERGYPLAGFYAARFFRLAPLFWIAVIASPLLIEGWSNRHILLNLTFLFSIANPGLTAVPTGGWSLGIEFVYYLLFPILAIAVRGHRAVAVCVVLFIGQMVLIDLLVRRPGDLSRNWVAYVQPASFIFYFYAGMLIGKLLLHRPLRPSMVHGTSFLALAIVLAAGSGANIDDSLLGARRYLLPLAACALVYSAAHLFASDSKGVTVLARGLGNASYGIYLLHPIVAAQVTKRNLAFAIEHPLVFLAIVVVVTVPLALVVERWVERPIREYGKSLFTFPGSSAAVSAR